MNIELRIAPYPWHGETFPLYALYPSSHLPAAKVRAFIDFVMEVIERQKTG